MAQPKKKTPRTKKLKRRAKSFMPIRQPALGRCPNCGGLKRAHYVCRHCGWYKGREVITIKVKETAAE